jgi:hypothetical protein
VWVKERLDDHRLQGRAMRCHDNRLPVMQSTHSGQAMNLLNDWASRQNYGSSGAEHRVCNREVDLGYLPILLQRNTASRFGVNTGC